MNKQQHIFIWIGIALLTFMAVVFESKFIWVISAIALMSESVFVCKSKKLSTAQYILLLLAIIVFVLVFLLSLPRSNKLSLRPSPNRRMRGSRF